MEELTQVVADDVGGAAGDEVSSDATAGVVEPISHGLLTERPTSGGVKSAKAAKPANPAKAQVSQTQSSTR
jgi:hypothetical protein